MWPKLGSTCAANNWSTSAPDLGQMQYQAPPELSTLQVGGSSTCNADSFQVSATLKLCPWKGPYRQSRSNADALQPGEALSHGLCGAGEPISTRWTSAVMQEIKRSRIETTRKLVVILHVCSARLDAVQWVWTDLTLGVACRQLSMLARSQSDQRCL